MSILLVALATAVGNAVLGGTVRASVSPVLAIALGDALFLLVDTVFGLQVVIGDLPTHVTVLTWMLTSIGVGLGLHLVGTGIRWIIGRVPLTP